MFFTLSKEPDYRLPYSSNLGSWWFSHDDGWEEDYGYWIKGYEAGGHGNFLTITRDSDCITFNHGHRRSFPLWWDPDRLVLTNLLGTGQEIRADKKFMLFSDWLITENVDIHGKINVDPLTLNQATEGLIDILNQQMLRVIHEFNNSFQFNLFVTGGIDTVTILAMMRKYRKRLRIVDYEHFDYDIFTNRNMSELRKRHWAYRQIHHWRDPMILASGAYGDEYMMRGPNTVALWCAWQNIDLLEILRKSQGYHVGYYLLPKNISIFQDAYNRRDEIRELYPTYTDLVRQILDINANDHQHWHLGETITWTPFLQPELTKVLLRLPVDDLINHFIDATVNRNIIQDFWPECSQLISTSKNQNSREHLDQLQKITNPPLKT